MVAAVVMMAKPFSVWGAFVSLLVHIVRIAFRLLYDLLEGNHSKNLYILINGILIINILSLF